MKCSICGEMGHRPGKCPELYKDLDEGFYQGGGGGHSHDDDCDDRAFSEDLVLASMTTITTTHLLRLMHSALRAASSTTFVFTNAIPYRAPRLIA